VWEAVRHTHSYPHAALARLKLRVVPEETQANMSLWNAPFRAGVIVGA